jgi:hypothetical protein
MPLPSAGRATTMMDFLLDEVKLTQQVGNLANCLVADYGIKNPEDLKYLSQNEIIEIITSSRLKKAQAGKLMNAWKCKVGLYDSSEMPDEGDVTYIEHGRRLLTQVYYRQNLCAMAAQFCESRDFYFYLMPIIIATSLASITGFLSCSTLVDDHPVYRPMNGLCVGFCGLVATVLSALRNSYKLNVQAEKFRLMASQYRNLSTKLERRMRLHRHALNDTSGLGSDTEEERHARIEAERHEILECFADIYEHVMAVQAQMLVQPPQHKVAEWVATGVLSPNPMDQPFTKFKDRSYQLSPEEYARALYLLTQEQAPFDDFRALPEVQRILNPSSSLGHRISGS